MSSFLDLDGLKTFKQQCDNKYIPHQASKYVTAGDANKPYYRIASIDTESSWVDASIVLAVDTGCDDGFGILKLVFRTNDITSGSANCNGIWLARQDGAFNNFVNNNENYAGFIIKGYVAANKAYFDVYFKAASSNNYSAISVVAINEGRRGEIARTWKLYDRSADSLSTPNLREYNTTGLVSDKGIVALANKANYVNDSTIQYAGDITSSRWFCAFQDGTTTIRGISVVNTKNILGCIPISTDEIKSLF